MGEGDTYDDHGGTTLRIRRSFAGRASGDDPGLKGSHRQNDDGAVWENNSVTSMTHFDYEEVERRLGQNGTVPKPESMEDAAVGLARILAWLWQSQHGNCKAAFTRFVALTAAIRPDLLRNRTLKEIGEEMGMTRANLSKASRLASEALRLQFRRGMNVERRRKISRAMKGHKNYYKGKD